MRRKNYSILTTIILLSLLVTAVSAVSVSITPTQIEEGDTVTIRIADLADNRVFSLRMESAIELHGKTDFTYQANAVTIPFGLNTPRVSLVASPVTRAGLEAAEGNTTKGMAKLGSGSITISETLSSIPAGTIDFLKANGIAESGAEAVNMVLELSGTKTGPDSGEITFGIEGISDGSARIIVLVDGAEINNQLIRIGSPNVGLPVTSVLSPGTSGDTISLSSLDGTVRLQASAGSVTNAAAGDLRIIQAEAQHLPSDWKMLAGGYIISPGDVSFTSPATLSFVMSGDAGNPFLALYENGAWTIIPSRVEGSHLVTDISRGGHYAMMTFVEEETPAAKSAGGWVALIGAGLIGLLMVFRRRQG